MRQKNTREKKITIRRLFLQVSKKVFKRILKKKKKLFQLYIIKLEKKRFLKKLCIGFLE